MVRRITIVVVDRLSVGSAVKLQIYADDRQPPFEPMVCVVEALAVRDEDDEKDHPLADNRMLVRLPKPLTVDRVQFQFCLLVGKNSWRIEDAIERGFAAGVVAVFIQPRKHLKDFDELNNDELDARFAFTAYVGPRDGNPNWWTCGYTEIPSRIDPETGEIFTVPHIIE